MFCGKNLLLVSLLAPLFSAVAQESPKETTCTIWQPGLRYETKIHYELTSSQVSIVPGDKDKYQGCYTLEKVSFHPTVRCVTENIRKEGTCYTAYRFYDNVFNSAEGIEAIHWNSTKKWWISRKWDEFFHDVDPEKILAEPFQIFGEDTSAFDDTKDEVLMVWDAESLENFLQIQGEQDSEDESRTPLRIVTAYTSQNSHSNVASRLKLSDLAKPSSVKSPQIIQDSISSECNTLASALFWNGLSREARKTGARGDALTTLQILADKNDWWINATALNGLLVGEIRNRLAFGGELRVYKRPLRKKDFENAGKGVTERYQGVCLTVVDSEDAYMAYYPENGRDTQIPLEFNNNKKNKIEFWFDTENQVLRHASVAMFFDGYKSRILPNPGIGKFLKDLKGTANGGFVFKCEYDTAITPELSE